MNIFLLKLILDSKNGKILFNDLLPKVLKDNFLRINSRSGLYSAIDVLERKKLITKTRLKKIPPEILIKISDQGKFLFEKFLIPHSEQEVLNEQFFQDLKSIQNIEGYSPLSYKIDNGNITELNIHSNFKGDIVTLPENIGNLTKLEIINIWGIKITTLPESIGNLKKLKHLSIKKNQLKSLPASFGNLHSLQRLELSKNLLTSLPESFGTLNSLKSLFLENNNLASLPDSFGNLNSLEILNLQKNNLSTLPDSFMNLESLECLMMDQNPLRSLSNINFSDYDTWSISSLKLDRKGRRFFIPYGGAHFIRSDINIDRVLPESLINSVMKYYEKSPLKLARLYCEGQNSISKEEKERFIWEAGARERNVLELHVSPEDPILKEINERMSIKLQSGFKIIK